MWVLSEINPVSRHNSKFVLQRKWNGDRNLEISSFSLSHSQDLFAISFKSNDICTFEMCNILPTSLESIQIQRELIFQKEVRYNYL